MKSVVCVLLLVLVVLLFSTQQARAQWVTIDVPGAEWTEAYATDGSSIVGQYYGASGYHGFLYDGTNWSNIDFPGAYLTTPIDIDAGRIVGTYNGWTEARGFQFDGTTWETIAFPGAHDTVVEGCDGSYVVGYYGAPHAYHGFLYDGVNWITLDAPGAGETFACDIDISRGTIVGSTNGPSYGWIYDIDTKIFTPLYGPGGVTVMPRAIGGSLIGGYYVDGVGTPHGFLYDGTTWTVLDYPGATGTIPRDIEGNLVVGPYYVGSDAHGFLYELEPRIVEAAVDIDPDTFNLDSKGNWVTCYVELPEEYEASDIDVDSVLLEGLLEVEQSELQDGALMVKFDREDLATYLEFVLGVIPPVEVELVVTGNLTDGTPFEGSDTIGVIDEGGGK